MEENYLEHHGILGQKWGVRRYQNEDGTLTEAGKKRTKGNFAEGVGEKRLKNRMNSYETKANKSQYSLSEHKRDEATGLHVKRKATQETLEQPDRVKVVGKKTIMQRTLTSIGAGTITAGSAILATAAESAIPLVGIPAAAVTAGYLWTKSYR